MSSWRKLMFISSIVLLVSSSLLLTVYAGKCIHEQEEYLRRLRRSRPEALDYGVETSTSENLVEEDSEDNNDFERTRIEYIKQQILQKLGMSRAPSVLKPLNFAEYLNFIEVQKQQKQEEIDTNSFGNNPEESDKVFVSPVSFTSMSSTFNLSLNTLTTDIPGIRKITLFLRTQVWTNNEKDVAEKAISVASSSWKDHNRSRLPFKTVENNVQPNPLVYVPEEENEVSKPVVRWLEYELTHLLLKEIEDNKTSFKIASHFKILSSFITLEFEEKHSLRRKRSVDCEVGAKTPSCCREHFYVNFTHIGWDNWILQPSGYSANFCRGQCDLSHARYHHTTVIQKYPSTISLCCSPREMSHISLIYVDEDGFVYQKILQNMTVESCDCA